MAEYVQVVTTTDSADLASKIAQTLLESRVAACVQVLGPVRSKYWWKGNIEEATEWICMIKARAADYDRVEALISEAHSYDVPEILAFPVQQGSRPYLEWLDAETSGGS
ncbi:MAG: divalent-cation tolerance protein CutA [Dehalococcoidia bacterium]